MMAIAKKIKKMVFGWERIVFIWLKCFLIWRDNTEIVWVWIIMYVIRLIKSLNKGNYFITWMEGYEWSINSQNRCFNVFLQRFCQIGFEFGPLKLFCLLIASSFDFGVCLSGWSCICCFCCLKVLSYHYWDDHIFLNCNSLLLDLLDCHDSCFPCHPHHNCLFVRSYCFFEILIDCQRCFDCYCNCLYCCSIDCCCSCCFLNLCNYCFDCSSYCCFCCRFYRCASCPSFNCQIFRFCYCSSCCLFCHTFLHDLFADLVFNFPRYCIPCSRLSDNPYCFHGNFDLVPHYYGNPLFNNVCCFWIFVTHHDYFIGENFYLEILICDCHSVNGFFMNVYCSTFLNSLKILIYSFYAVFSIFSGFWTLIISSFWVSLFFLISLISCCPIWHLFFSDIMMFHEVLGTFLSFFHDNVCLCLFYANLNRHLRFYGLFSLFYLPDHLNQKKTWGHQNTSSYGEGMLWNCYDYPNIIYTSLHSKGKWF